MNAFELREPDWNAIEPARLTAEPKLQAMC